VTRTAPSVVLVLGPSTGGIGAHVRMLVDGLVGRGFPVRVCGPPATDTLFGFAAAGAAFVPVPIAGAGGDPRSAVTLRRTAHGADVIHAHGLRAGTVAALAGRRPLVVTWHNAVLAPAGPRRRVLALGEAAVARAATLTLTASPDLARRACELGGRDVRYAPVAAPRPVVRRSRDDVRAALGLDDDRPLIVSVGRLHPQKRLDVLVEAAARWPDLRPLVAVAGDGPEEDRLRRLAAQRRAPVRLLGRRADVPDLLAAADLVVLTSRWEARALVAQEALILGRPLVATAVGGLPALLGPGARLVPPGDVDALDVAVRALLSDPVERAALAARGRTRAGTWPTPEDTVDQVVAVYRELTGVAG
jgi:glycosyltransferase involved in cell wall biosynthesis